MIQVSFICCVSCVGFLTSASYLDVWSWVRKPDCDHFF